MKIVLTAGSTHSGRGTIYECGEWKAGEIVQRGLRPHDTAHRRWLDLMERETRRLNELEYYE